LRHLRHQLLFAAASLVLTLAGATAQQFDDGLTKQHLPYHPLDAGQPRTIDYDKDGDADVLIRLGTALHLWRNDGKAVFTDDTAGRLPALGPAEFPGPTAVADVDGDLDPDFVCVVDWHIRLYRNNGFGVFADVTNGTIPTRPEPMSAVAFTDVDGDGDQDLLSCRPGAFMTAGLLFLFRNGGSGVFTFAGAWSNTTATFAMELADFDRDGRLDALLIGGSPTVMFANANGSYTAVPLAGIGGASSGAVGDLDGDQAPDLVLGYTGDWFHCLYAGNRTFTVVFHAQGEATAIGTLDADGDGDLDVLLGSSSERLPDRLLLNNGAASFTASTAFEAGPESRTTNILVADLDGNGRSDALLSVQGYSRLYLAGGSSGLVLANRARLPVGYSIPTDLVAADFDGDGDRDLITLQEWVNAPARVFRNDGTGQFVHDPSAVPILPSRGKAIAAGDLDGDGDMDAAVATSSAALYLINDGAGHFVVRQGPAASGSVFAIALTDVDGDSDLDAVLGGSGRRMEINDGQGFFTIAAANRLPAIASWTSAIVAGDVDGDGDVDLVFGNYEQDSLLRNNGSGTFLDDAVASLPPDSGFTHGLALVDLDGDGDLDLFQAKTALGASSGRDTLSWNDGTGHFVAAAAAALPTYEEPSTGVVAGDVDRDGDVDLVVGEGGLYRLFLNAGGGQFTEATTRMPRPPTSGRPICLVDLDRDADLDLAVLGTITFPTIHAGLHHQLRAPLLALRGRRFDLEVLARPGYGTSPASAAIVIGWQLAPAPILVPPFGTFLLAPASLQDLIPWVTLDPVTGRGTYSFVAPTDPGFLGFPFHAQAFVFDAAGIDAHLTGMTSDTIHW